jgi:hypothetical protein
MKRPFPAEAIQGPENKVKASLAGIIEESFCWMSAAWSGMECEGLSLKDARA